MVRSQPKYYSLRSYWSYLSRYKYRFFLTAVVFMVANVLLAIVPLFIGQFVEALAAVPLDRRVVYRYTIILILCSVGHDFAWRAAEILYLKLLNGRNYEYGNVVFRAIIRKPYPYFVGKFTGKISSHLATLTREYRELVTEFCYEYVDMMVKLPTIAVIMFSVNLPTGLVFLANLIVMFAVGRVTMRRSSLMEKRSTDVDANLDGYIIDVIANFVSVKAFRKERVEAEQIAVKRQEAVRAANQSFFWALVFWGSMSLFVRYVIWPGTIVLNVWLFLEGRVSLAEITTFTAALVIFSDYIWAAIWNVSQVNLKLARIEEAYRYLFGRRNVVEEYYVQQATAQDESAKVRLNESLRLDKLQFAYPDDKETAVLSDITLNLAKGEKVGIVGRSGSGKTSLIKLLLGYYGLPTGVVAVDGQPLDNRRLVELISYVPQDTSLFHRTIAENIAYGADQPPERTAIEQAAKQAHAHEFIIHAPKGYDTLVGEKGIKLSMGQRQRIAIARAFLDDKPLLILDEATSALDSESEVLVQQALENLWQDKTVIAIAHRLSTLRHMDRIVVMDGGRIVEQGTHRELLAKKGYYHRLWEHQSGGLLGED